MAERSILVKLRGQLDDLASTLRRGGSDVKAFGATVESTNAKMAAGAAKQAAADKAAAAASTGRVRTRVQALAEEGKAQDQLAAKYGRSTAAILKHSDSITTVSRGVGAAGLVMAAGVGLAVSKFVEFDKQMSAVAATGADAQANLSRLRQAAIDAGAATQFSATEAAAGVENLLKAGISAADVLGGGLNGALNLAAASNLSVAAAAETAASAMNQFGLAGSDIPHIADLLAQAAGTAQGEVSDMAAALGQSGLIAHQFGLDIDTTSQTLALFAKNGLLGSDAGTSFKTMLTSLYAPAGTGAAALSKLGISGYDAAGNLKPLPALIDQLRGRLSTLTEKGRNQALRDIFGSDAIRAGSILLKEGSAGLRQVAADFDKFGTAADVARIKMDNLAGDIEQLKGSLDTALIGAGSGGNQVLRAGTQAITDRVNAFNRLAPAEQKAALIGTAIAAGSALAVAGVGRLVTKYAELRAAVTNIGGAKAAGALGLVTKGAVAATAALVALNIVGSAIDKWGGNAAPSLDEVAAALLRVGQAGNTADLDNLLKVSGTTGDIAPIQKNIEGLGDALDRVLGNRGGHGLGGYVKTLDTFTSALHGLGGAAGVFDILSERFNDIDVSLTQLASGGKADQAAAAFKQIADEGARQGKSLEQVASLFPKYRAQLDQTAASLGVGKLSAQDYFDWMGGKVPPAIQAAASAAKAAGTDISGLAGVADTSTASLSDLVKAATDVSNQFLAMSGSEIGLEAAIDAAGEAADKMTKKQKASGAAFDATTKFGREHLTVLNQLATSTSAYAQNVADSGASVESVGAAYAHGRDKLIGLAVAMGKSREDAIKFAGAAIAIPTEIRSQFVFQGAKVSRAEAKSLNAEIRKLPKEQRARIVTIAETKGAKAARAAIEQVKDKTVIARSKGDLKGARDVNAAMKALKDRLLLAKTRGDKSGAIAIQNAMNALRDRTVWARVKGDPSGAYAAINALAAVHDKTATIYTRHVSLSGQGTGGGRAGGGKLDGPGTETSDSIPILGSRNEWVIKASSSRYYGDSIMAGMNAGLIPKDAFAPYGYKDGGKLGGGGLGFAAGGKIDVDALMRLITALNDPLSDISRLTAQLSTANRAVARPYARYTRANRAYQRAVDRRDDLRDDVNRLRREADATKGITAADRELKRARQELADANARVSKTSHEKTEATKAYNKVAGKSKELTKELTDAQKAFADSARSASTELSRPYRSQSHDVGDILASMKEGAADLVAFQRQIVALRKQGLNETLVQQIIGQGALVGGEIAGQITGQGKLITSLNKANDALQKAADNLGYTATSTRQRKAVGGPIIGPGTGTSDDVPLWASNGEWIVDAARTSSNLPLLKALTYGTPLPKVYAGAAAGGGGMHRESHYHAGDISLTGVIGDPDKWLREARNQQRDAYSMSGLGRGL